MEKDTAVRNQKVMIRLASVLELQSRYTRVAQQYADAKAQIPTPAGKELSATYLTMKRAFEQVIDMLELPIPKVS